MTDATPQWRTLFEGQRINRPEAAWLATLRQQAFDRFDSTGFPHKRTPGWRHTPVQAVASQRFEPAESEATTPDLPELLGVDLTVVFLDGKLVTSTLPTGDLTALPLASALDDAIVKERLLDATSVNGAFTDLNTAFARDGLVLRVKAGTAGGSVHLVHIATTTAAPIHLRHVLVAEPGSTLTVIEHYAGHAARSLTNVVTDIVVQDNAQVTYARLQQQGTESFHLGDVRVQQARDSRFTGYSYTDGARLCRVGMRALLAGPGAECRLNGLYLGRERQHLDHTVLVEHAAPHCDSHQVFKGILDERARGVFSGTVRVHKDAQKTNASQSNRNLLLSERAHADSEPMLLIHADDVKCSHGSAIGHLDDEALYYLRARGIGLRDAQMLLTRAFAADVLEGLPHEGLQQALEQRVAQWLDHARFGEDA